MAKKKILCSLLTCPEPGDEKCHIKDAAILRKELEAKGTFSPNEIEKLVDHQNHVMMCPNHHRIYFDRIKGPRHQKKLLLIDTVEKIYIIAKETIMNLQLDDCEVVPMRRTELVKREYADWKNERVDEILKIKLEHYKGLYDDW